jgi:hypothetical protein
MSCKSKPFGEENEGDPAYQNADSHNLNPSILDFATPALSCFATAVCLAFSDNGWLAFSPLQIPRGRRQPVISEARDAVDVTTEGYFEERGIDRMRLDETPFQSEPVPKSDVSTFAAKDSSQVRAAEW